MQFESPIAAALNHLLESEPWARERLVPFAGERLKLRAPPLPELRFVVASDGRLGFADGEAASLVITVGPGALAGAFARERRLAAVADADQRIGEARAAVSWSGALADNIQKFESVHGNIRETEMPEIPMNFGGPTAQA